MPSAHGSLLTRAAPAPREKDAHHTHRARPCTLILCFYFLRFWPIFTVAGRDPVGFGDCPPYEVEEGHEDALEFFDRVNKERQLVQQRLTKIHEREKRAWLKKHPQLQLQVGD